MARKIPSLRRHSTGVATVRLDGKDYYFGRYGTPQAEAKYRSKVADWLRAKNEAAGSRSPSIAPTETDGRGLTIGEMVIAFHEHATTYYRREDGTPTGETANVRDALRPVMRLYGESLATSFGVRDLDRVRIEMVRSGLSRGTVNARVNRIRRVFTWTASRGSLPGSIPADLRTLAPLRRGRSDAPEADGIEPVPIADVEATLPFLAPVVSAMVRLQLLSGMRVSELLALRIGDVDRSADPWEYRPGLHKGTWRDKDRVIPLGPRAQEVLSPYLDAAETPTEFAFRPAKGKLGRYDRRTYRQAIVRACDRAFPAPVGLSADEAEAWQVSHRWTPLQLRHTAGTSIRARFGLEAAQVILGHARADVTQIYADRDLAKAREVASSMG